MAHPLLKNSHGNQPQVASDDIFPEGITAIHFAAEDRTVVVALGNGFLVKLTQAGKQIRRERGFDNVTHLAWSAAGRFGAAALNDGRLLCFNDQLKVCWKANFTGRIVGLAVSPFGSHIAVSTEGCRTHIVTSDKREIGKFETPQPLQHLKFLDDRPALIGAAEFGHLCSHQLNGAEDWNVRIMNNVGDMFTTGDGKRILLAAFNHGIQVLDDFGQQQGAYMLDGVPARVAASSNNRRVAAITLENRLYWLSFDGDVIWVADLSQDPPLDFAMAPLADRLFVSTQSGRLLQLLW